MRTLAALRIALLALGLVGRVAGAQPVEAEKVLAELGFPADTIARVKAGQMVHTELPASNERELGVGLAFRVSVPPAQLVAEVSDGLLEKVDPNFEKHGQLSGDGSLSQLAELELGELAEAYADAKPGSDLNLSSAEIRSLQALKGKPSSALDEEVRRQILKRYQDYRSSGLDGIPPYDRGREKRSGSADLRSATEAASPVKAQVPDFYATLLDYPKKPGPGLEEAFHWARYKAHGEPVFILTHVFTLKEGDAYGIAQRQFYVSGGYNVEQAIAAFFPVAGGTLVVYVNRTSTDQVEGLGGGTKRAVGKKLLASQLEQLFTKFQQAADS